MELIIPIGSALVGGLLIASTDLAPLFLEDMRRRLEDRIENSYATAVILVMAAVGNITAYEFLRLLGLPVWWSTGQAITIIASLAWWWWGHRCGKCSVGFLEVGLLFLPITTIVILGSPLAISGLLYLIFSLLFGSSAGMGAVLLPYQVIGFVVAFDLRLAQRLKNETWYGLSGA